MSPQATTLGTFAVIGTAEEAKAYRAATGMAAEPSYVLPLTFPMRWLATTEVRAAIATLVPQPDLVLVHESQTFDYVSPLRAGERYAMTLTARRKTDPDQLIVDGVIASLEGKHAATLETILRLFSSASGPP